jgi:hypothetical protein
VISSLGFISEIDYFLEPINPLKSVFASENQIQILSHSLTILISKGTANNLTWGSD